MVVNKNSIYHLRIVSDLLLLNVSFIIAGIVAHSLEQMLVTTSLFYLAIIQNLVWIFTAKSTKLYDDFRSRDYSYELIRISRNTVIQLITAIIYLFFIKERLFDRYFITVYIIILWSSISLKSYLLRRLLSFVRRRGYNIRKLLIVGAEYTGIKFDEFIKKNSHLGYKSIGIVDDDPGLCTNGEYLGKIDEMKNIIKNENVNDVVITLPNYKSEKIEDIVKLCDKEAIRLRIVPDYSQYFTRQHTLSSFGTFPVITLGESPLEEIQWRFAKRLFDIIFSSIILITVLSWLIPVICLFQKLLAPGPLFFVQDRVGKYRKIFKCYKFRTMQQEKSLNRAAFNPTEKDDPSVTAFGKFLRKTNLDEVPQFINVFLGDMSIVGPRPHAVNYSVKYREFVEQIKIRHNVRPGITGWAQIHGLRGDIKDEKINKVRIKNRIEHDIWYIENWSFSLDLQIIFLTLWRMVKGDPNAY